MIVTYNPYNSVSFCQKEPFAKVITDTAKSMGIKNIRTVTPNIISGSTFEALSTADFTSLKKIGVDTIVDFRSDGSELLKNKCRTSGIGYLKFPLDNVLTLDNPKYFVKAEKSVDHKRHVTNDFINELKQYFQVMNKDNAYVGCYYGIDRTNMGLTLNYLLNPKAYPAAPEILTWPGERKKSTINKLTKIIKKILKSLTEEQRQSLGLSINDNNYTNSQILKLLRRNNNKSDF